MGNFYATSISLDPIVENMAINLDKIAMAEHIRDNSGDFVRIYMSGCQYPFYIDGDCWESLSKELYGYED